MDFSMLKAGQLHLRLRFAAHELQVKSKAMTITQIPFVLLKCI